jgi:hypothetical protein
MEYIPFPIINEPNRYRRGKFSFFHTYFKSLYPNMYKDMLNNMGEDTEPKPDPAPAPTPMPMQSQREERSEEEIAAANKIRMQDRLAGKYTIQGQVVGQQLPEFTGNEKGINSVVNKWITGKESDDDFEGLGKLGKVSLTGQLNKLNDKSHQKNIQQMIQSKGEMGGAAMLYDPSTNSYVGVTLNEQDLGEQTSALIKGITGKESNKRYNFVGNLPPVAVFGGEVYNTKNMQDRQNLILAIKSETPKQFNEYINRVETNLAGTEQSLDVLQESTPTQTISSDVNKTDETKEQERKDAREQFQKDIEEQKSQGNQSAQLKTKEGELDAFNTGGFIGGMNPDQVTDAQTVADDYPIDSDDGDFMINASIIEQRPDRFNEIISAGLQKAREKGVEVGDISGIGRDESGDVLASKGEFLVKKPLAEVIGYDVLNEFNDQGKPEVNKRVAASGGFLEGYANGGEVDLPATRPSAGLLKLYDAIKETFPGGSEDARKTTKEFLNQMSNEEALALTAITEASVLGEKGLESVMHVVNNRINSDYADFKSQFNVKDVLNRQTAGGAFQFTGLEIKGDKDFADLRTHVTELVTNPQAYRNYMKNVDTARKVLQGKRKDFTGGALFYYNPEASTSKDFKDKVANRTYVPIYYMKGEKARHVYFSPQEIYRPQDPVPRPETPTQRIQKKFAQQNFLDEKVDLSKRGMFGTFLANRPSLQTN